MEQFSEEKLGQALRFNTVTFNKLPLNILNSKNCPLIANIEIYNAPIVLSAPTIIRDQAGTVRIIPADDESQLYYTLDGTFPTHNSAKYTAPFKTDVGKIVVNARRMTSLPKYSPLNAEQFDKSRKLGKLLVLIDENSRSLMDGDPNTQWFQDKGYKMPVELAIDLGETVQLSGFKYLPDQHWWGSGIITKYSFSVSMDSHEWKEVDAGEFSNIKNNPIVQVISFAPTSARYIKLTALGNTQNNDVVGYYGGGYNHQLIRKNKAMVC